MVVVVVVVDVVISGVYVVDVGVVGVVVVVVVVVVAVVVSLVVVSLVVVSLVNVAGRTVFVFVCDSPIDDDDVGCKKRSVCVLLLHALSGVVIVEITQPSLRINTGNPLS